MKAPSATDKWLIVTEIQVNEVGEDGLNSGRRLRAWELLDPKALHPRSGLGPGAQPGAPKPSTAEAVKVWDTKCGDEGHFIMRRFTASVPAMHNCCGPFSISPRTYRQSHESLQLQSIYL